MCSLIIMRSVRVTAWICSLSLIGSKSRGFVLHLLESVYLFFFFWVRGWGQKGNLELVGYVILQGEF